MDALLLAQQQQQHIDRSYGTIQMTPLRSVFEERRAAELLVYVGAAGALSSRIRLDFAAQESRALARSEELKHFQHTQPMSRAELEEEDLRQRLLRSDALAEGKARKKREQRAAKSERLSAKNRQYQQELKEKRRVEAERSEELGQLYKHRYEKEPPLRPVAFRVVVRKDGAAHKTAPTVRTPFDCEHCGTPMMRNQWGKGNRFCSKQCSSDRYSSSAAAPPAAAGAAGAGAGAVVQFTVPGAGSPRRAARLQPHGSMRAARMARASAIMSSGLLPANAEGAEAPAAAEGERAPAAPAADRTHRAHRASTSVSLHHAVRAHSARGSSRAAAAAGGRSMKNMSAKQLDALHADSVAALSEFTPRARAKTRVAVGGGAGS